MNATNAGWDTSFANSELIKAEQAAIHFNFDKAERILTGILDSLYSIDVSFDKSEYDPSETVEISISILDSDSETIPVSLNAKLLDINKSVVLAEAMDLVVSANPATLSLLIPGTVTGGIHRINLDVAFNGTNYRKSYDIMITGDDTPPIVTITSPQHQSTVNSESITISWTVAELGSGLTSTIIFVDDLPIEESSDPTLRSYALTLTDGTHIVKVQCTDAAGNTGEDEISIIVDTTPPTTTTTTSSNTSGFTWVLISSIISLAIFMKKKKK